MKISDDPGTGLSVTVSCENRNFKASSRKILSPGRRSVLDAGLSYFRAGKDPEDRLIPDWVAPGAAMENMARKRAVI